MDSVYQLKTPDYSHLTSSDFEQVYEPAEDTFLLLDSLEKDADFLHSIKPTVCVEVGCGSGLVITALAELLNNTALYIATDRNPRATLCTKKTAAQNGCRIDVVNCDLLVPLEARLTGSVDVLIFNPPYVVTPSAEVNSNGIEASWAGGKDGREVTDRLLPLVPRLLSPSGAFYLVAIRENKLSDLMSMMSTMGLESHVIMERRSGPEHLSVIKFYRTNPR